MKTTNTIDGNEMELLNLWEIWQDKIVNEPTERTLIQSRQDMIWKHFNDHNINVTRNSPFVLMYCAFCGGAEMLQDVYTLLEAVEEF